MRMCVWWARGGGDAVALAWSLRRAAPRLLLDDADPAVSIPGYFTCSTL